MLQGKIDDMVPSVNACITDEGNLSCCREGDILLTVDTGFTGCVALPQTLLDTMTIDLIGSQTFTLATGAVVQRSVYVGTTFVGDQGIETLFIPGDHLIGMDLLASAGCELRLDLVRGTVKLLSK